MIKMNSTRDASASNAASYLRWQVIILLSMYLGYAALMVCRNTLIATSATMIESGSLDKESFGHLMSWHSAGAIAGKLVTGPGADLLGGRRMFLIALAITGAANIGFAFCTSFFGFAAFNFIGQFAKAGGWPAMTKLVGTWYPEKTYGRVWSVISTSSRVGTIVAAICFGFLLTYLPWRGVFVLSAAFAAMVFVCLFFYLKDRPDQVGLEMQPLESSNQPNPQDRSDVESDGYDELESKSEKPHPLESKTITQACVFFLRSWRCWLICLSIVFLTIVMDFLTFIPIYLAETLGLSAGDASMAGSCFPVGMFVSLLFSGYLYDRVKNLSRVVLIASLLTLSCMCVVSLWRLDLFPSNVQTTTAIVTLFLLGFTISPAYYIPMSIFSVSFGGRHSGFLVSVIDIFGYAAALLFNYFGGSIAQDYGWSTFLAGLLGITISANLCMTAFLAMDWRATKFAAAQALESS